MKNYIYLWIVLLMVTGVIFANSAPVVSNVTVSQLTDGSGIVNIYYWLEDADEDICTVSVVVSDDEGSSWTITPSASALMGAVGEVAPSPGAKKITWYSKQTLPGTYGTNYRIKVIADDGPSGMVFVHINNDPGIGGGHEGFNGYISKYETTNAQYCQFLNSALADGLITVYINKVYAFDGINHSQLYYNLFGFGSHSDGATNGGASRINYSGTSFNVDSGFENHPVSYVSWYGATAFASYYGCRLPTEWEWQAVADYDGTYTYGHGSGNITNNLANYINSYHPHGTTVVGAYSTTHGYGMFDMAGNVYEWTSSIYRGYHAVRGGCFNHGQEPCRVAYRGYGSGGYERVGFRVCMD